MKRLAAIGKGFILLGEICLFWREKGPSGFGRYESNALEILLVSLFFLFVGLAFIGYSKYREKKSLL